MPTPPEDLDGYLFKWRTIGQHLGVSARTLQRWCAQAGIRLPHWHHKKTEPVFLPEDQLGILIVRLIRSPCGAKLVAAARRKKLYFVGLFR